MKQRVALARALAPNPRVLLMDEPFAALDALTREQLYGDLQRIWAQRRKTIVFVTHNVREAACLGDRVVLFSTHPGRIREQFTIDLPRATRHQQRGPGAACDRDHADPQAARRNQWRGGNRMKRTLRALVFFLLAVVAWDLACRARIWSPVLVPSPGSVVRYLWSALLDGTLLGAIGVTMKRLLLGYLFGIALGLPLGLLTARFKVLQRHAGPDGRSGCRPCERVLGAARAALVRADRIRDVFRRRDGHAMVGDHRDRQRRAQRAADLRPGRAHHGFGRIAHVAARHAPASLPFVVSGMKQGWAFAWRSLMAAEITSPS